MHECKWCEETFPSAFEKVRHENRCQFKPPLEKKQKRTTRQTTLDHTFAQNLEPLPAGDQNRRKKITASDEWKNAYYRCEKCLYYTDDLGYWLKHEMDCGYAKKFTKSITSRADMMLKEQRKKRQEKDQEMEQQ